MYNKKHTERRKQIAKILNSWRKKHLWGAVAKEMNISKRVVQRALMASSAYKNSIHRKNYYRHDYNKEQLKIKNSKYRNRIALYFKLWMQWRSVKEVAIKLGTSYGIIAKMLNKSMVYKCRKKYSQSEKEYATTWSKKIWAINLLGGKCQKCQNDDVLVLEFHHCNEDKEIGISNLIRKDKRAAKKDHKYFKKETLKCQLLCRNCHQEIHHPFPNNAETKQELLKLNGRNECIKCGYSKNISCLDFHHIDRHDKEFNISLISDPRRLNNSLKRFLKEIKKCHVYCCNCHQKEHIKIDKFANLKLLIDIKTRLLDCDYVPRF